MVTGIEDSNLLHGRNIYKSVSSTEPPLTSIANSAQFHSIMARLAVLVSWWIQNGSHVFNYFNVHELRVKTLH
jgi:hypothetical protein